MIRTRVGYAGGDKERPSYRNLGNHTEALQIEFDPERITYEELLRLFFASHDPHRRGGSTQYKSVLWTHGEAQAKAAKAHAAKIAEESGRAVKTEILPAPRFWLAEDYHQKYYLRGRKKLVDALFGADVADEALRDATLAARVNGWVAGHGSPEEIARDLEDFALTDAQKEALGRALGRRAPATCGAPADG